MMSLAVEKNWQKDLYRLAIVTLITALVWIGAAIYQALSKNQVKPEIKKISLPLTPGLDIDTMEKIKQRQTTPLINWESLKLVVTTDASPSAKPYEPAP